jgi:hypothetical protein
VRGANIREKIDNPSTVRQNYFMEKYRARRGAGAEEQLPTADETVRMERILSITFTTAAQVISFSRT